MEGTPSVGCEEYPDGVVVPDDKIPLGLDTGVEATPGEELIPDGSTYDELGVTMTGDEDGVKDGAAGSSLEMMPHIQTSSSTVQCTPKGNAGSGGKHWSRQCSVKADMWLSKGEDDIPGGEVDGEGIGEGDGEGDGDGEGEGEGDGDGESEAEGELEGRYVDGAEEGVVIEVGRTLLIIDEIGSEMDGIDETRGREDMPSCLLTNSIWTRDSSCSAVSGSSSYIARTASLSPPWNRCWYPGTPACRASFNESLGKESSKRSMLQLSRSASLLPSEA